MSVGPMGTGAGGSVPPTKKDDPKKPSKPPRKPMSPRMKKGIGGLLALLIVAMIIAALFFLWPFGGTGDDNVTMTTSANTALVQDQAVQICVANWQRSGRPVPADLEAKCVLEVAALYKAPPSPKGQSIIP